MRPSLVVSRWECYEQHHAPLGYLRAVEADYQRLRRYLAGDWEYVGVVVTDADGNTESLGGIESDADEYLETVAHELAMGV